MGFGEAIASFYRGYFDFEYRSCRSEFWWSTLFKTLVYFAMVFIAITLGAQSGTNTQSSDVIAGFFMLGVVIFYLVNFIPNLAITVRRFHDQNQSFFLLVHTSMLAIYFH